MARFTANDGSAWMKDQEQLEDRKLLKRYKAGERDFSNFKLYNIMPTKKWNFYFNDNEPADFSNENLTGINLSSCEAELQKLQDSLNHR